MSQPTTVKQLTDAERIAILDKRVDLVVNGKYNTSNTLLHREPFSAVIHCGRPPLTKSDIFWGVVLTIFTFGLGLIFWGLMILIKLSKESEIRLDVTPTGGIVKTKLSANR